MTEPKYKIGNIVLMLVPDYVGYLECTILSYHPKSKRYILQFDAREDDLQKTYGEELND